jgi:polynucleotide 5'-hydroxyl-kinase GRC3/NOL9
MTPAPAEPPVLDWDSGVARLAEQRGVVLLVGAGDVGKTTLTLAAANAAVRAGRKAAILDTDLGQSEVGPPGTLGIVRLDAPAASTTDLKPRALAFVGAAAPPGHLLPIIQGTSRLVTHALERQDDVVYVDTSGFVEGRLAEKLKLAKLTVLAPDLVVFVRRGGELGRLIDLVAASTHAPVITVRSAPTVRTKSVVYRRLQRANRLRKHFEGARIVEMDAGRVRTFEGWLYSGEALTARQLRSATETLGIPVMHGEVTADGVFLCAAARPPRQSLAALQEDFGRRRITVTPAAVFQSLLVGLVGSGGLLADIGLLQGVNFERALFSGLTPARSVADVRQLHFGRLRLRPDGSEIAALRPSDL